MFIRVLVGLFGVLWLPMIASAACEDLGVAGSELQAGKCVSVDLGSGRQQLTWDIDGPASNSIWEITASGGATSVLHLTLIDPAGTQLAANTSSDGAVSMSDLGLSTGQYTVQLHGRSDGPVELRLVQIVDAGRFLAAEPDGSIDLAREIEFDKEINGRLVADRSGEDRDILAVSVDKLTLVDVVVNGPKGARLRLALLNDQGVPRQEIRGEGTLALVDLGLTPGTHWFQVRGKLEPDQSYSLVARDRGAPADTQEFEPNDSFETATRTGSILKGQLTAGNPDYIVFKVEGDPQLWRFQAAGDTLSDFSLLDNGGKAINRGRRAKDSRFIRLSNVYLMPGRHVLSVSGKPGRYLFRAIPMGPPPEPVAAAKLDETPDTKEVLASVKADAEEWPVTNEIEPNDSLERAIALEFGERRTGLFDRPGDLDVYAFHLTARQRVQIRLTADPEIDVVARLNWGEPGTQIDLLSVPAGSGGPLIWDGVLQPGDYSLVLNGKEPRPKPYAIELIRRPIFDATDEAEPNDVYYTATPIPPDGRVNGDLQIGRPADIDWIKLPAQGTERTLKVIPSETSGEGRRLDFYALLPRPGGNVWETRKTKGLGSIVSMPAEGGTIAVPANTEVAVKISGAAGPYALYFGEEGKPVPPKTKALDLKMDLTLNTDRVAAFSRLGQRISGTLTLTSLEATSLRLDAHSEDAGWIFSGLPETVDLAQGKPTTLPIMVEMPPDLWDASARMISIRATDANGDFAWVEQPLAVDISAPEVGAHTVWPATADLLGGINVAAKTFGGEATFVGRSTDLSSLIDGLINETGSLRYPGNALGKAGIELDLAGDAPHVVKAVILHHAKNASYAARVKDFVISTSEDGEAFSVAGHFQMTVHNDQQVFVLKAPMLAKKIRINVVTSHDPTENGSWVDLDEIEVIAGADALGGSSPEIGLHDRGGHLVSFDPYFYWGSVLNPEKKAIALRQNGHDGAQASWVVGFNQNRKALIESITWHDSEKLRRNRRAARVRIEASTESPFGPWSEIGEFPIDQEAALSVPLPIAGPIQARYLRFKVFGDPDQQFVTLPNKLEIREAPASASYRSILGFWGRGNRSSWFEYAEPVPPAKSAEQDNNDTRETAELLAWKKPVDGTVSLGADIDWFEFSVPDEGGAFSLLLEARPAIEAAVELFDGSGQRVNLDFDSTRRLDREYRARLKGGNYFLKVTEIPRSVLVTWDTSGSVARYVPKVFRAVRGFARDISTDREVVNFLPFADPPEPLLDKDDWADNPVRAGAALHTYSQRNQDSSNSESALLKSMELLAPREGVRAIIMITDAVTDGYKQRPVVWRMMEQLRPRVFTMTVPNGGTGWSVREPATALRDWAVENGGFNQTVAEQGAIEQSFRRVAAWLRRPAPYRITADLNLTPPDPGELTVSMDDRRPVVRDIAVEVILDASGSMLKRMDGTRRYLIAKKVLNNLVTKVLPENIPFALRVFGQGKPDSCDTNLQAPLSPLNASKLNKSIKSIRPTNLAKTPIGDALSRVAGDLEGVEGPKLVILLTDGEETCDGDPAAEIAKLRAAGFDVQVNIVGFAIDDQDLAATFKSWARAGGGSYFAASDANSLAKAMNDAVTPRFNVLAGDKVVGSGQVNDGVPVELLPGDYVIRIPGLEDQRIKIEPGQKLDHRLSSE